MRLSLLFTAILVLTPPAGLAAESAATTTGPSAPAQALTGDWDANLVVGTQSLPLVLHFRPGAAPAVSMDSPLQGAREIPATFATDGQGVTISVASAGTVFHLKPSSDGNLLDGSITQNASSLPLTFRKRAGAIAAVSSAGETAVQVAGPLGPMKGTLSLTEGPAKATAVIIAGSGPTDRDGDSPLGITAQPYRLLAQALAVQGIESIRYDKRGGFASAAAVLDGNSVTIEDYASDARNFAALAAQRAGLPCAWLIGHSEGALVALAAAQQPDKVCGLVLLSGPGRKLGSILREQLAAEAAQAPASQQAAASAIQAQANAAITKLEANRKVDTTGMDANLLPLFRADVQDFLMDEFRYNPVSLLAAYKGPVLVLHGSTDTQVAKIDADNLEAARAGVKRIELSGVNHVLKTAPADSAGNEATYSNPALPLAPGVAEAVSSFILAPG